MASNNDNWDEWRERIIGLGNRSAHKSYYAQLQKRMADLRRFRVLLDNAGEGVFLARSTPEELTDVNDSACELLGYAREQLLGRPLRSLFEAPGWENLEIASAEARVPRVQRVVLVRRDGEKVPVEVMARAAVFEGESYVVVVVRDLRERLGLESKLLQAEKMESVGRLAGGVAHDFNNILTAIQGNVALALMDLSPAHPVHPLLQEIRKASESAAALTRQLLAFSRKHIIEPRPINLSELIETMKKMLCRLIGEDISLRTATRPLASTVLADPNLVEQAVINLAINARDAMPEGGTLTLETAEVQLDEDYCARRIGVEPGTYVLLAVSDSGTGMSEEVKQHLFEPFFTTKEKGRGTGLGLASVYGTVSQAGGTIDVYSELGVGTCIKMYFPRCGVEGDDAEVPEQADSLAGKETLLFVEDDPRVARTALRALERLGYRVLAAQRGEVALRQAKEWEGEIHLLVTDVVMPGMNGRALAEALRRERPTTRVLFTSGYTQEVIVHHGVLEPGVSFLSKPYTPRALALRIRQVLDGQ